MYIGPRMPYKFTSTDVSIDLLLCVYTHIRFVIYRGTICVIVCMYMLYDLLYTAVPFALLHIRPRRIDYYYYYD